MTEKELALSSVRDRGTEEDPEEFDSRIRDRLKVLGRGRSDYMYVAAEVEKAPRASDNKTYYKNGWVITVICRDHPKNTNTGYYFGTTDDGKHEIMLPKVIFNNLEPVY